MSNKQIFFSHATNSLEKLDQLNFSNLNFIEFDLRLANNQVKVGHDEKEVENGPNLDAWLDHYHLLTMPFTINGDIVGLKLDFKMMKSVEPSLIVLQKCLPLLYTFGYLWLNADILIGPNSLKSVLPIDPHPFIKLCLQYYPNVTLSLGWTTGPENQSSKDIVDVHDSSNCSQSVSEVMYTDSMIDNMLQLCQLYGLNNVTFPLRLCYVESSWHNIKKLLDYNHGYTLTIWSNQNDHISRQQSDILKQKIQVLTTEYSSRVYYDLYTED